MPLVERAGAGGAGTITFASTLDGTTAGQEDLNLTAGTGNILFTGAVGGTRLGAVTIASATNVTAANTFAAASINQVAGSPGGTTWFQNTVNTNAAGGIDLNTVNVTLDGAVTTTSGGPVQITNTGLLDIADAVPP